MPRGAAVSSGDDDSSGLWDKAMLMKGEHSWCQSRQRWLPQQVTRTNGTPSQVERELPSLSGSRSKLEGVQRV